MLFSLMPVAYSHPDSDLPIACLLCFTPSFTQILASPSKSQEAETIAFTVQTWRLRHEMIKWPTQGPAAGEQPGTESMPGPQTHPLPLCSRRLCSPLRSSFLLRFPCPSSCACWLLTAHSYHKRPCPKVGQILGAIHAPGPGGIRLS